MAIQFNELPAGRDANAANALQNLRDGFMVDRFTGARVNRTIVGQSNTVDTVFGTTGAASDRPVLTIDTPRVLGTGTPDGAYHITDRTIIFTGNSGQLLVTDNGKHVSFYNCTFVFQDFIDTGASHLQFAFGIVASAGTGGTGGRAASAAVATGAAATRSINFYGCTVTVGTQGERTQLRCQMADCIGSDFRFTADSTTNGDISIFPSPQRGGRWINSTFVTGRQYSAARSNIFTYGFPEVYEGVELYGLGIELGFEATSAGPQMLIEPNFSFNEQEILYVTQGGAGTGFNVFSNIFQNVGFFSPPDLVNNDDNDVIAAGTNAAYVNMQQGGGGALNYAVYQPTYLDAVTGNAIRNVKVRVNTSATLSTTDATTSGNFHTKLNSDGTAQTVTGNFIGNEYLTNANGQLVTSMRTNDGWSTSSAGSYDPMIFDFRNGVGETQLAMNDLKTPALAPPRSSAMALIHDIRGTTTNGVLQTANYTTHQVQYQAFSWSHDILQELTESSTNALAGSTVVTRQPGISYDINTTIGGSFPSAIGTFVKTGFTNVDNTPDLTALQGLFDANDVPSINDVRMAARYERYQNTFLGNPQTERINLVVNNTAAFPWLITGSSGVIVATVRGAGLIAKPDDLFTAEARLGTVNMNGNPITGLTLGDSGTTWNGLRTGAVQTSYAVQGGAISGTYTSASGGDIFFDGVDVSGLNIVVTSGTLNIYGTRADGTRLVAGDFGSITGDGNAMFPVELTTNTINITTPTGGYYAIRRNNGGVNTEFPERGLTRFAAGSTVAPITYSSDVFTTGDSIDVYIKYDSDVTTNTYYQEQVLNFPFDTTMDAVHTVSTPQAVANALVGTAQAAPAGFQIVSSDYTTTIVNAQNTALITIQNSAADADLDVNPQQGLSVAALVGNTPGYFESWYTNRDRTRATILVYGQDEIVTFDRSRITFASNNVLNTFRVQHTIRNWEGTGTGSFALARTGAPEISAQTIGAAGLGTVIQAIDGSSVAASVEDIKNFNGYISQGTVFNVANPNGRFDRTSNYRDNIERN